MADYDVLVAGGGPVGASLALALHGAGLAVALFEPRAPRAAQADPRPIALSHGSRLILERLGVWGQLAPATPILRIHVSQRGGFGRVELDAAAARLPALGYVVDYGRLAVTLETALESAGSCRVVRAAVTGSQAGADVAHAQFDAGHGPEQAATRLLAVADGGALASARVQVRDYLQAAVTARVTSSAPHRNIAYERFTPEGPLALLPMGQILALVWTTTPDSAQQLCAAPEAGFLERLQCAFGGRLGAFSSASARAWFPLTLKTADHIAEPRTVALGNAAQTLHPVAGQGFNLGLRDAWELAAAVRSGAREEIGNAAQIAAYRKRRQLDRGASIWFTDALVRLFSNDIAPLRLARGLGLAALGAVPPVRDFVVRRMTFGTRG